MRKIIILLVPVLFLWGCLTKEPPEEITPPIEVLDVVTYNRIYKLTYSPVYEEADEFSYLVLNRDGSFFLSVNTCDGVDFLLGNFEISDNVLFLIPPEYSCDFSEEECDSRGIRFTIENPKKLVITNGLRCITDESVFEVES